LLSRPGAAYTPLRFPGQYHDLETGLHYNFHRYYDPETGRYISHDPLGLDPAPDSLAYVVNPTGWVDPLGLAPCNKSNKNQDKGDATKVAQGSQTGKYKLGSYHGYDTYLDSHQNKHQSTKMGELGTYKSKTGTQFPPNVGISQHQNYLGPTAASIGKQGPTESPALTNKHDAYLAADQQQAEKYKTWQDAQKKYNHDQGATAADVDKARQNYLDAKKTTAAKQDEYGQAHQKYNKDGYVDSQGNFTTNSQASRDGIRYQTSTDNTTNPPHVDYHAYPDDKAGGVGKWKQHDSKTK
jgi:RHS repeat-associated protein